MLFVLGQLSQQTASANQFVTESQAAMESAEFLSYLESVGDSNGLFDMIHPDAHAVIPRAAVIGWYEHAFFPLGPGVATVTEVRFIEWTWPVNGRTYPHTAEVSFVQPFADGSLADEVVRLVQDEQGQWRWFFGRSIEFVNEQVALYADRSSSTVDQVSNPIDVVAGQLENFWSSAFSGAGLQYSSPHFNAISDSPVSTGCGIGYPGDGPGFYCSSDMAIYVDVYWVAYLEVNVGDFAWITVLAHEWGHHIQHLLAVPHLANNMYELQADCLAGSFARDAETLGLLGEGDVTEAVAISSVSGDPVGLPQDEPGAHGTSDDRITAFMRGFLDGFIGCDLPLTANTTAPLVDPPVSAQSNTLEGLLPNSADLPSELLLAETRSRSLAEVAANYSNPLETVDLFTLMGWKGNVVSSYEGTGSDVESIYVSIHQFATAEDAELAMDWSVADQSLSTGANLLSTLPIGDTWLAMGLSFGSDQDFTLYSQTSSYLVRVTVTASSSTAESTARMVTESIVTKIRN